MTQLKRLLSLAILLILAGCRQSDDLATKKAKGSQGLIAVRLALNWMPEAEHGGYYAADVHGFFADEGLKVELIPGGPETTLVPVARGQIEFGVCNADNILFARAQQAPVVALLAPMVTSPRCIMVHESSGIRSLEELHDVTIAMSNTQAFTQYLQTKLPLPGVRVVPYNGSVAQFLEDKNFAQQAYVFSEPYLAKKAGGDPKVLLVSDLGFNPYTSLLYANEDMIKRKPEVVVKMVRACQKGWRKYLQEPQATNERIHAMNPLMDDAILQFGAEQIRPLAPQDDPTSVWGLMTAGRWQELCDQLVESKQLRPDEVDPSKAFDIRFLLEKK